MTTVTDVEVVIDLSTGMAQPWNLLVGNGADWPPPPVVLFLVRDVAAALRDGSVTFRPQSQTAQELEVTRDGFATVYGVDGQQFLYELFPSRFSTLPYEPKCYLGRWPD